MHNGESRHYFVFPGYIKQNLIHELCGYQRQALYNLNYTQHDQNVKLYGVRLYVTGDARNIRDEIPGILKRN